MALGYGVTLIDVVSLEDRRLRGFRYILFASAGDDKSLWRRRTKSDNVPLALAGNPVGDVGAALNKTKKPMMLRGGGLPIRHSILGAGSAKVMVAGEGLFP